MTLSDLTKEQQVKILSLPDDTELAIQLLEQGFVPNSIVSLAHKAPWKGPLAFRVQNTKISLGHNVAEQIKVAEI